MSWLRLDDRFCSHPKFAGWSATQKWALIELFVYCAGQKTDGHVPPDLALLPRCVTRAILERAQASGFLEPTENGGLKVHDWEHYNPKDPTKAERQARWRLKASTPASTPPSTPPSLEVSTRAAAGARGPVPSPSDTPSTALDVAAADAGWTTSQQTRAAQSPTRALAWLEHSSAAPGTRNRGALAWAGFQGGGWPQGERDTVAPGAMGTRSVRTPVDVVPLLRRYLASPTWDETVDEEAMLEDLTRRATGYGHELVAAEVEELLGTWREIRSERFPEAAA